MYVAIMISVLYSYSVPVHTIDKSIARTGTTLYFWDNLLGDQVFTVFRHMKPATNREHSRGGTIVPVARFRLAGFTQTVTID